MKLIELTKEKSNEVKNKSYPVIKNIPLGILWWSSGYKSVLSLPMSRVQFLKAG